MSTDAAGAAAGTPTGAPAAGGVRASDAEREEYAKLVRDAVGEGRLTLDEGDERLARIYAAKFRDELRPMVSDLPGGRDRDRGGWPGPHGSVAGQGVEGWHAGRHPGHWTHHRHGGFGRYLVFVTLATTVLVGLWALSGAQFFWPAIFIAFFGLGLIRRLVWRRWWSRRGPARAE